MRPAQQRGMPPAPPMAPYTALPPTGRRLRFRCRVWGRRGRSSREGGSGRVFVGGGRGRVNEPRGPLYFFRVVSSKHEFAIWPRVLFLTEYANKCNGSAKKGTRTKILVSMKGSKVFKCHIGNHIFFVLYREFSLAPTCILDFCSRFV